LESSSGQILCLGLAYLGKSTSNRRKSNIQSTSKPGLNGEHINNTSYDQSMMPPAVAKSLSRLSRQKLVDICEAWSKSSKCDTYLSSNRNRFDLEEEDYLHEPAQSRQELKAVYGGLREDNPNVAHLSKRDIIDRILDGDWRRGLSYDQLASIDFAHLEENDAALRWTALKLVPMSSDSEEHAQRPSKRRKFEHTASADVVPRYPETTAAIFVQNLKQHISPLVKAHYHVHRIAALRLSVVRLYITPNAPFAPLSTNVPRQGKAGTDSARTMFIALPDSCPYVYVSVSGSTSPKASTKVDVAATKRVVLEAIPKALSRPQQRWSLETTRLIAKSLQAMTLLRGNGKVGSTGGTVSQLSQPKPKADEESDTAGLNSHLSVQHQNLVEQRFGTMEGPSHAKLDRVQVRIENLLLASNHKSMKRKQVESNTTEHDSTPLTITLSGSDVFAGLKQFSLLHPDYVDVKRLPVLFTGEQSTTTLAL